MNQDKKLLVFFNILIDPLFVYRRMASILGFAVAGFVAIGSAPAGMQPPFSTSGIDSTSVVVAPALDRQFPLKWRMGAIDSRFGLDASEVKQAVEQAIRLWESAAGKRLFVYDRSSGFPVNLVYDSRHAGRVAARQVRFERNPALERDSLCVDGGRVP